MTVLTLKAPSGSTTGGRLAGEVLPFLAQLCTRTPHDADATAADIRLFAESEPDWAAALSLAADHSVAPLLCKRLPELAGDALPAAWRARFRMEFMRNMQRNLFLTAELFRALAALERAGVQAMPFKGPVLACQAYGDLALRQFADLDVVLPHSQILEAHRALEAMGYHSENPDFATTGDRIPGQYSYRNDSRDSLIELHTEKTMRYLPVPLDWPALNSRCEMVSVGGRQLRTFSLEDTLMLLCVHGTKHFWNRLGWICDIAELVQVSGGLDWERSEKLAGQMRCRRMWLLGLTLAHELLAAPLPEAIMAQIQRDTAVVALSRQVQTQFLNCGDADVSAAERLRFRVNSQDTLAAGLRQAGVAATRPTEQDWNTRRLPRWASPLYMLLRPWRIVRDYGLGPHRKAPLPR